MSLNHRTAEVGRHLGRSCPPTPCKSWVSYSRLPRTVSGRVPDISKDGDSTTSPCATCSSAQLPSSWTSCCQRQPFEPDHSVGFQSTSLSAYPDPYIISLSVRILRETVLKPYYSQDKQHSLLSLIHQTSHLIVGGYQVGYAQLALCKFTPTENSEKAFKKVMLFQQINPRIFF